MAMFGNCRRLSKSRIRLWQNLTNILRSFALLYALAPLSRHHFVIIIIIIVIIISVCIECITSPPSSLVVRKMRSFFAFVETCIRLTRTLSLL